MTLSPRERKLVIAAGAIGLATVLYLVVTGVILPAWTNQRSAIQKAEADQDKLSVYADQDLLARKKAKYDALAQRALPYPTPEDAERVFVQKLNSLARQASMTTPAIEALTPTRDPNYDLISFSFKVTCTLEQFVTFSRHFYDDATAQRIDSIAVVPVGRMRRPDNALSVTFRISAVVIPPAGKTPAKRPRAGGGPAGAST